MFVCCVDSIYFTPGRSNQDTSDSEQQTVCVFICVYSDGSHLFIPEKGNILIIASKYMP